VTGERELGDGGVLAVSLSTALTGSDDGKLGSGEFPPFPFRRFFLLLGGTNGEGRYPSSGMMENPLLRPFALAAGLLLAAESERSSPMTDMSSVSIFLSREGPGMGDSGSGMVQGCGDGECDVEWCVKADVSVNVDIGSAGRVRGTPGLGGGILADMGGADSNDEKLVSCTGAGGKGGGASIELGPVALDSPLPAATLNSETLLLFPSLLFSRPLSFSLVNLASSFSSISIDSNSSLTARESASLRCRRYEDIGSLRMKYTAPRTRTTVQTSSWPRHDARKVNVEAVKSGEDDGKVE